MRKLDFPAPCLTLRLDGLTLRDLRLEGERYAIGRRPENDIQLDDSAVSGLHAVVTLEPSPYLEGYREAWLTDLESTNGTTVNGTRVGRQRLVSGDVIGIGRHELLYLEQGAMDRTVVLLPDDPAQG